MDAIWTFLRLCGIVVGVATLLRLATIGFGVEYKEFFQAFLDQVSNIVELGFLIGPLEKLIHAVLDWLRGWNLPIPDLQPHWRPEFTLIWLLMSSTARNLPGNIAGQIVWAFVCAVVAAVAAGTQPLASWAAAVWPWGLYVLFTAGLIAPEAVAGTVGWNEIRVPAHRRARVDIWTFRSVVEFAVAGAVGYFTATLFASHLDIVVVSRTLIGLVGLVATVGLWFAFIGVHHWFALHRHDGKTLLTNLAFATGLDILGVMGLALAIGYVMMK